MAIKAKAQITLVHVVDIESTWRFYTLQSSTKTPSKPTVYPPPSIWTDSEPKYTQGDTNSLYYVDCTVFSNGEFQYSEVSISSAYESAKQAYNKAVAAQNAANNAQNAVDVSTDVIIGTQTAATGSWTGVAKFSELKDGQSIMYWLPYAGSGSATLNLTLSDGSTTGAINCYYKANTRLTTHYSTGSIIRLVYRENAKFVSGTTTYTLTGWWADASYEGSNTYDRTRYQQAIKCGTTAIVAANIIVGSGGVYKHLTAGTAFDISYPILYAADAISASKTGNNNYVCIPFTVTTTQSITLTAYTPVYIKGTLSGTTFTPISTAPLTQTVPTSADGYDYILLGQAYSTTAMYLLPEHPIFTYYNDGFKSFEQIAVEAAKKAENAQEDIDNLEVGGRNLILGTLTADPTGWTGTGWSGGIATYDASQKIYQITATNGWRATAYPTSDYAGEQLTFSAYFKLGSNSTNTSDVGIWLATRDSIAYDMTKSAGVLSTDGDWQYITCTFDSVLNYIQFMVRGTGGDASTGTSYVLMKEPKIERGNRATDWTPAPEDVDSKINDAQDTADQAVSDAKNAQETADGKNTAFYQTSAPTSTGRKVNDIWFDTDDGNKMYYWSGSAWTLKQFGGNAIAAESVTTNHLTAKAITAAKMNIDTLSAITANLGTVTTGVIQSSSYADSSYGMNSSGTTTGTVVKGIRIDLANQEYRTPQIIIKDNYINLNGHMTIGSRLTGSTDGTYSFTQGLSNKASSGATSAFGMLTEATALAAFAQGMSTNASGQASFAGGKTATASGEGAFAFGNQANAIGNYSQAFGLYTKTAWPNQFAVGKYNRIDTNYDDYEAFTIGNGTSDTDRSNAFEVWWDGSTFVWGYFWANEIYSDSLSINGSISEGGTALSSKYAPLSHSHSYLPLSGGTLTSTLNLTANTVQMNFRPGHASYDGIISYQTGGNEAMVFSTMNAVTSFMFVNGEATASNLSTTRWQSLTPGLQIKNNCVSINKLIANGVTPSYTLEVGGTIYASSTIYEGGTALSSKYAPLSHTHSYLSSTPTYIELNSTGSLSGYGGFIDFHFNGSTDDYTSRIIENASGTLSINGVTITTGKVVTATTFAGALSGNATSATTAGTCTGNAATATKATNDKNGKDITRVYGALIPMGTAIPSNADLNTTTYIKVGNYSCTSNATSNTLTNCPIKGTAFMMQVYGPLASTLDDETTSAYRYRIRKIIQYNTGEEYIQFVSSGATAGTFTYGAWRKVLHQPTAGTAIGSSTQPIYINSSGVPTACGTVAAATKATQDGSGNVITSTYLPLSGGTVTGELSVTGARIKCLPTWNNTCTYATNVYVGNTGQFTRTTTTSSRTIKHDIKDLTDNDLRAEKLYDLNVVQFKYNEGIVTDTTDVRYGKALPGFIIEDMDEQYPIAIDKPSENVAEWSWNEKYLIPPMLKLIQEQHKEEQRIANELEIVKAENRYMRQVMNSVIDEMAKLKNEIEQLKLN